LRRNKTIIAIIITRRSGIDVVSLCGGREPSPHLFDNEISLTSWEKKMMH
jgi:hypothetical protein